MPAPSESSAIRKEPEQNGRREHSPSRAVVAEHAFSEWRVTRTETGFSSLPEEFRLCLLRVPYFAGGWLTIGHVDADLAQSGEVCENRDVHARPFPTSIRDANGCTNRLSSAPVPPNRRQARRGVQSPGFRSPLVRESSPVISIFVSTLFHPVTFEREYLNQKNSFPRVQRRCGYCVCTYEGKKPVTIGCS